MQKDGEKPSLHCWGVAPPGRCNAPVPSPPPPLPRPLPFAGEGAAHAVGAGGAGAAGVMGRDCSSVLLEITIAMLRAEEQKALLRHCLSFPPHPPSQISFSSSPIFAGWLQRGRGWGWVCSPAPGPGGVSCLPPQPGEGAGLEMCLEGNANQCLGLPQLGDGAVNKGAVPGCPFSPLPPRFFGQK